MFDKRENRPTSIFAYINSGHTSVGMYVPITIIGTLIAFVLITLSSSPSSLLLLCENKDKGATTSSKSTSVSQAKLERTTPEHAEVEHEKSGASYQLAYDESFGFFDDITDDNWRLMQQRVREDSLFFDPDNPSNGFNDVPMWMLNNVDPMFTCPHVRRMGGKGDGPKWVCDPHRLATKQRTDCLVYSIGSNGNYLFEDSIVKLVAKYNNGTNPNCQIHVFDPNPSFERPNDKLTKNIHYHAWGLVSSYDQTLSKPFGGFEFKSFQETQQLLGHVGRRIDLFKIDCEGCEFHSYQDWIKSNTIQQIMVEVHPRAITFLNLTIGQFFADFFSHGYVPYSKEANTHPAARPDYAALFEFGFIRLKQSFFQK
jgi:Methyltransferase domain